MSTPAGRPCLVITTSSDSASRRYRERSSFTLARATRRGRDTLLVKPRLGLGLRDDCEDFDFLVGDVIEHPDLPHSQAVLWLLEAAKPLNAALAQLRWFVPKVQLDAVPDFCSSMSTKRG